MIPTMHTDTHAVLAFALFCATTITLTFLAFGFVAWSEWRERRH